VEANLSLEETADTNLSLRQPQKLLPGDPRLRPDVCGDGRARRRGTPAEAAPLPPDGGVLSPPRPR
jgi:hypothetical protein